MHINGTYKLASWPTAVFQDRLLFDLANPNSVFLLLAIVLVLIAILVSVECLCVPMLFCDAYWLYGRRWWPAYPSQQYLPKIYPD